MKVTRLAGALGAEVTGIDLSCVKTKEDAKILENLLNQYAVIFFPKQNLSIEEHIHLGTLFGKLEGHPNIRNPNKMTQKYPQLFELHASRGGIANEWHTDLTFRKFPAKMSILKMVKCPKVGGDTMFANLCEAYDALSDPMKSLCDGLSALHDADPHNKPDQMAIHPVVRVHPKTKRKALYVNEHFTRRIVEMDAEESNTLLTFLSKWVHKPEFTVRYRWKEGTIAIWDNSITQHCVLNDFDSERIIQRVTVSGDQPIPAATLPRWKHIIHQQSRQRKDGWATKNHL
eukprot:g10116.t1